MSAMNKLYCTASPLEQEAHMSQTDRANAAWVSFGRIQLESLQYFADSRRIGLSSITVT